MLNNPDNVMVDYLKTRNRGEGCKDYSWTYYQSQATNKYKVEGGGFK